MIGSIKDYFNICTIYIILWGLYGFHWYDIAKGSSLDAYSNLFLGVNLLISFICIYKMRNWRLPYVFRCISWLLVLFTIYGFIDLILGDNYKIDGNDVSKMSYFISIYRSFLPLYAFYYFARIGKLNSNTIRGYFILMFLFYVVYDVYFSRYMLAMGGYEDGFTNNLGYVFISLIPFAYVFERKTLIQYCIVIISMLLLLLSMKRGAIIIGVLLCTWFFYNEYRVASSFKKHLIVALSIVVVGISIKSAIVFLQDNTFAQARLEQTLEGNSSGRDDIYNSLLNIYYEKSNFTEMLVGHGPNAPARLTGHDAHNDWLEILLCQGFWGLAVYFIFWVALYRYWQKTKKKPMFYFIIGSFVIAHFLRSLISMSYAAIPTASVLLFGYAMAMCESSKRNFHFD